MDANNGRNTDHFFPHWARGLLIPLNEKNVVLSKNSSEV